MNEVFEFNPEEKRARLAQVLQEQLMAEQVSPIRRDNKVTSPGSFGLGLKDLASLAKEFAPKEFAPRAELPWHIQYGGA